MQTVKQQLVEALEAAQKVTLTPDMFGPSSRPPFADDDGVAFEAAEKVALALDRARAEQELAVEIHARKDRLEDSRRETTLIYAAKDEEAVLARLRDAFEAQRRSVEA